MTTIAYSHRDGEIAVDGRCTRGNEISSDSFKKFRKNADGIVFAVAGQVAEIDALTDSYPYGYEGMTDLEAVALALDGGRLYECMITGGKYTITEVDYDYAQGSGSPYALSALDFGCTARGAVKYAMKRDSATGGKIKVMKVR